MLSAWGATTEATICYHPPSHETHRRKRSPHRSRGPARAGRPHRRTHGDKFNRAVDLIDACRGRVVVTGMGKSGIIARKIAATLSSIGTPALFMHPVDAIHGDLGMVVRGDVVLALSASGETEEILRLLATIKRLQVPLISMTGDLLCASGGKACRAGTKSPLLPRPPTSPSTVRSTKKPAPWAWLPRPRQRPCWLWAMRWPSPLGTEGFQRRRLRQPASRRQAGQATGAC